ncbi:P-loop containing nucleoside triphosphate hydrolase protein [Aspergillus saccharolyticus JOP 1030-1]|uniref:P-loop containing nucleoside triphosphate hydrolase protein n=1 Tax=Aspergillus saccharolyticus JOP 1030-1 TaxID=1450539 RepID=A0A318ZIV1_9EURO|nr:P-loop containing nucleoside triphosphate hydrolase protein [Aspergillus saccharolyticus JOP 1030-1]PYH40178.1 P-loop containing nucleoside triphosphate hydrolase protein [Aspergillus saccharolyticus JOP 1030-1]
MSPYPIPVTSVGFDFTPLFEDTILSLLPSALLLLVLPYRLRSLHGQRPKVSDGGLLRESKTLFLAVYAANHLALLILRIIKSSLRTNASIPESTLAFVASIGLCLLSRIEHSRSIRPSPIINTYILLTLVFDIARLRTLFLNPVNIAIPATFSSMIGIKVMVLLVEAVEKRRILLAPYSGLSPEETSGIYGRSLFFWLNQLMVSGYHKILQNHDLFPVDSDMSSLVLHQRLKKTWNTATEYGRRALFWSVLRANLKPFLFGVVPRLFQIGFKYAQSLLLDRIISFASNENEPDSIGWGLTGAFLLVLLGLAVSNGVFYHMAFRFVTIARGSLISVIYAKTVDLSITSLDESVAVTLMSSDVQAICNGFQLIHDLWGVPLELGIVIYLLSRQEAKLFRRLLVLRVFLANSLRFLAPPLTFAIYARIAEKGSLNVNSTYTTLSLISLAASPVNTFIRAIPAMNAALASFDRIQGFLQAESRQDHRLSSDEYPSSQERVLQGPRDMEHKEFSDIALSRHEAVSEVITARNVSFAWTHHSSFSVHNINLNVRKGQFCFIIGPVGCGKSTLIKGMLGETPSAEGFLYTKCRETAFVDQTPWISNQSFRDNILGASNFEETWYHEVVNACGLDQDVANLPNGHSTQVGSSGISLSGGQKQRLALARAIYATRTIVMLDDSFSGLDTDTEEHVFKNLFARNGIFRRQGTTVILATHAVHRLPYADHIVAMRMDGTIAEQGTLKDLKANGGYVALLSSETESKANDSLGSKRRKSAEVVLAGSEQQTSIHAMEEELTRQNGDLTLYMYYFGSVHWLSTVFWMTSFIIEGISPKLSEFWVKIWMSSLENKGSAATSFYLGLYAMLSTIPVIALLGGAYHLFMSFAPRSAERLHERLLQSVMQAPLSFFTSVDTGITMNRFSQDMTLIDHDLPYSVLDFVFSLAGGFMSAIMICISTRYFAAVIPPFCLFLWILQKFYLRTSRQMRLLDLEAKSPLFSHFLESLSGLVTIRAFGWQSVFEEQNLALLNASQKPFYLLFCIQRWLELALDLSVAILGFILMILVVRLRTTVGTGFVGLAILNVITFSQSLSQILRNWADLETSLGAIARIRDFITQNVSENKPGENNGLEATDLDLSNWPSEGAIEFRNVFATYKEGEDTSYVLRNLSLSIQPGQKIGICGRSGSGKSSLLSTLFRLLEIDSKSQILIDGVNIASIPRETTRTALNAIPQEPFFTHGTVRANMDPYGTHSTEVIESALRRVKLWHVVEMKGGLNAALDVHFFSHGQRQLFCLARALLRKSKVIVLDEVTSNVDVDSDALMQRVIREEFSNCTILAVAHRLASILDFDRIAVIKGGELVEFDTPESLLGKESAFKELYEA